MQLHSNLTADELRRSLRYDPSSGNFTWLVHKSRKLVGATAGFRAANGYCRIGLNYQAYQAHRLAWLYMTDAWPTLDIDHIDLDRFNNRWANLRLATSSQNGANQAKRAGCSSSLKGVTLHKDTGRWQAQIKVSGKCIHLGLFNEPSAAHAAYVRAAKLAHGDYARAA